MATHKRVATLRAAQAVGTCEDGVLSIYRGYGTILDHEVWYKYRLVATCTDRYMAEAVWAAMQARASRNRTKARIRRGRSESKG